MKLRILWPGKTRKSYYADAIEDYSSRIKRMTDLDIIETKEGKNIQKDAAAIAEKRKAPVCVVLDSEGKQFTSIELAEWLQKQSTDIDFILGGPVGLPIKDVTLKLSLGKLTLPHELARVVLLEQIYRAMTIIKRIPYHK
ncbi:MAG: 23S rRNA (pseudouridine(1915)-N(3))-methyltransferase RlmH [Acidobacteria bacterium]|nr:MAG: 23S rRNA (pseudouridine(1915)-N(3))-methyltransferase RlmH [Acidobacteriota bacterium]